MASIHVKEPVSDEENTIQPVGGTASTEVNFSDNSELSVDQSQPAQLPEVQQPEASTKPARRISKKQLAIVALIVVVGALGLFINGLINDRQRLQDQVSKLSNPQAQSQDEARQLKDKVGALIELPGDELPTVATVVDADKIKNQAFFSKSQNQDKVLLFAKAGKAVLYRPSTNRIIEVAPINLNQNQQTNTDQTQN